MMGGVCMATPRCMNLTRKECVVNIMSPMAVNKFADTEEVPNPRWL